MVELVDTRDLKSLGALHRESSSLSPGTTSYDMVMSRSRLISGNHQLFVFKKQAVIIFHPIYLPSFSRSLISVRSSSCFDGSSGLGASSSFFFKEFIPLTSMNMENDIMVKSTTV